MVAKKRKTHRAKKQIETPIKNVLDELRKMGDILMVMFEYDGKIQVDFWTPPSPRIVKALGEVHKGIKKHLEIH